MKSRAVSVFILSLIFCCGLAVAQDAPKRITPPVKALPKPGVTVEYVERVRMELQGSAGGQMQVTVSLVDVAYSLSVVESKADGQRVMRMRFGPGSVLMASPFGMMSLDEVGDLAKIEEQKALLVALLSQFLVLENRIFEFRRDARNRILDLRELPRPEGAPAPRDLGIKDAAVIANHARVLISQRLFGLETRATREGRPSKKRLCYDQGVYMDLESTMERRDAQRLVTQSTGEATKAEILKGKKDEDGQAIEVIRQSKSCSMRGEAQTTISRVDGLVASSVLALTMKMDQGKGTSFTQVTTTTTSRGKLTGALKGVPDDALPRCMVGAEKIESYEFNEESLIDVVVDLVPSDDRVQAAKGEGSRLLVRGRSVSLGDLRAILKASGIANTTRRDQFDPRLSATRLLLRCHGGQAIGLAKVVMELCADPKVSIVKINLALAGNQYMPLYLPTHVSHQDSAEGFFDDKVFRLEMKREQAATGLKIALRYRLNGKPIPGTGVAARGELKKRLHAAFAEAPDSVVQFDVDDQVAMQDWVGTFGSLAAEKGGLREFWFRGFGMRRALWLRERPVSDLQLKVWTKALKLTR